VSSADPRERTVGTAARMLRSASDCQATRHRRRTITPPETSGRAPVRRERWATRDDAGRGPAARHGTLDRHEVVEPREAGRGGSCGPVGPRPEASREHKMPRDRGQPARPGAAVAHLWDLHRAPGTRRKTTRDGQVVGRGP
jgi:hypothetical protein